LAALPVSGQRWTVDAASLLDMYRYDFIGTTLRIGTGIMDLFDTVWQPG
jgi:hypothetical protein